jgi:hypothetical protein
MDSIFNYYCQGDTKLKQEFWTDFATGSKCMHDEFPLSLRELIDTFLEMSKLSFEYLNILPEEKFNKLPESNVGENTETVGELIQRISLHFLGHTGQIYLIKKELGKGGSFVSGVKKKQREDSRKKWIRWWRKNKHKYE